ncbi:endonuclease NucS [Halegenticoccus tardaugens]|uniref:endonuclease NucS n=1 Tax=Halegenticoccus tardaugens TaxID=2071624 RepID=UPI00100B17E6|nr:endonuclease NucS [Halegenticoccus tardaugens]
MRATTLYQPTHREVLWELEEAFERGELITLFGRCTVEYDGRAASTLGAGDRLVILKPDGTALVHTDEKRTPVNWQPPGSEHHASVRDGELRVRSTRSNPDETLDVRFERVHQFSALAVTGGRALDLRGSEEDLRQHILDSPSVVEPGFVPLETERQSAAGPMDIYGEDEAGAPVVVELKRRRVGPSAASQLRRYVDALEREFGEGVPVRGILVAPSITDRTAAMLDREGLELVAIDLDTGRPSGGRSGDGGEKEGGSP